MIIQTNEKDFEEGVLKEWLITNGIGGYAMSTIYGLNTRKYHGLLVAALGESNERFVVLSKLNEVIEINKNDYSLSTNECPNYCEKGYRYEKYFAKDLLPEFFYEVNGVEILKKIGMVHGENKVAISYTIKTSQEPVTFRISPLVNFRNFHEVKSLFNAEQEEKEGIVKVRLNSQNDLYMGCAGCEYYPYYNTYYQNMLYREEKARGFDALESQFMPGYFEMKIDKNEEKTFSFVASVNDSLRFQMKCNAVQYIKNEEVRLEKCIKVAGATTDTEKMLVIAADNFVIQKSYGKTIIAGYPWFGDWGRDTFIALEGILLKTNRFLEAKEMIRTFAKHIQHGLVPNMIDENGGQSYNSVDASLWYIHAAYQYYSYTKDKEFMREIYPQLLAIITAYQEGTLYHIHMEEDGLISAGDATTQLTWMDAKVGDYIPTPRYGKAVEINALWYNALCIVKKLSDILEQNFDGMLIEKVKKSFEKFYAEKGLYDTIEPMSSQIRPNQLYAISLDFPVVSTEKAKEIIEVVETYLLTNKGLKTLNREDEAYRARYEGDAVARDSSYHQGTVWPFLLDAYFKACYALKKAPQLEPNFEEILQDRCIGNICEIYDADEPRRPNGAPAQAWSIGMALNYLG